MRVHAAVLAALSLAAASAANQNIFFLTDVHVEPFYDATQFNDQVCRQSQCMGNPTDGSCNAWSVKGTNFDLYGRPGCDPPVALLDSALAKMKKLDPNPAFILMAGDIVAHNLCPDLTRDIPVVNMAEEYVLKRITAAFPNTPVLPALGNNDMCPKNRNTPDELARMLDVYSSTLSSFPSDTNSVSEFQTGGYYHFVNNGIRVVVLNTGLVANKFFPTGRSSTTWEAIAAAQFTWLQGQLDKAKTKGEKVIIVGHMPPGNFQGAENWVQESTATYANMVEANHGLILSQLFGHHSTEMLRAFSANAGLVVSSGLAPRTSQYPTFQLLTTDGNTMLNQSTFYTDLQQSAIDNLNGKTPDWNLMYSVPALYNVPDASGASLAIAAQKIISSTITANDYVTMQFRMGGDALYNTGTELQTMLCDIVSMDTTQSSTCAKERFEDAEAGVVGGNDVAGGHPILLAMFVCVVLASGGVAAWYLRKNKDANALRSSELGEDMMLSDQPTFSRRKQHPHRLSSPALSGLEGRSALQNSGVEV